MEKFVYVLIISVVADYWLKRIIRIVYDFYQTSKRIAYYDKKGIETNIFGEPVDLPNNVVTDFKSDFEQFVFKKMD